jgi:hypothetical protein
MFRAVNQATSNVSRMSESLLLIALAHVRSRLTL